MVVTGNTVGRLVSAVLLALLLTLSVGEPAGAASFIRGDSDANGALEVTDPVRVFGFLFLGNPVELGCHDAADADDSGFLDISDGIYALNFLFTGGPQPAPPYPDCGEDPTGDDLDCALFSLCALGLPPRATFTAEPGFGQAPLEVFFDAAESSDPDGEIVGYSWSFGDGGVATGRAPAHVFETPGHYTVTLTVTDDGGSRDQASSTVVIHTCRPQAPRVEPLDELTTEDSVIVRGAAPGAEAIRVLGATGAQTTTPGDDGAFEVVVPLARDSANRISVSAQSDCELASSPVVVSVTHDSTPPDLHIDLPANGAALAVDAVDVIGRVGDLLGGFRGLAVTVNGRDAVVDVGIGNNGTYLARDVPLQDEGPTAITVEASDFLGNSASRTISVQRQAPAKDAPRIELVSGNGQTAAMKSPVPQPVVVRVLDRGGVPFAGKLVLFRISRSDGLLGEDEVEQERQSMQVRTDGDGLAQVRWRLGTDAGCGNNRLEASSVGVSGTVFVCASATPGPAVQINIGSGNGQYAESGALAPEPLRVRVSDGCNGAEGVPVTFTVVRGGGSLDGESSVVVPTSRTGHASTPFALGPGGGNHEVVATFPDNLAAPARFALFGTVREADESTSLEGLVLDNGSFPLEGARCTLLLEGAEPLITSTDASGRFRFDDIPGEGPARVYVYGLTVTRIGGGEPVEVPQGSFPTLSYAVYLVPEARNEMPSTVILPRLREANARLYDGTEDVELTVEGVEGLRMLVKAGSVRRPDGSLPTPAEPLTLALNQVHHDDVPMPMPDGAAPPFAWTLQPSGLSFAPPVEVTYPNLSTLAPGAIAWFLSFNHSTERFEIVSTGHVTTDGASILTDPGSGLTLSGWGCNCPPYSVCADVVGCALTISGEKLVGGAVENGSYLCFNQGESIRFTAQYDEDCGSGDVEWTIEPAAAGSLRNGQSANEVIFVQEDEYLSQEADDVVITCTRGGYTAEFRMTVFQIASSSGILAVNTTREFKSEWFPPSGDVEKIANLMNSFCPPPQACLRTREYLEGADPAARREVFDVIRDAEFFIRDDEADDFFDEFFDSSELWIRVTADTQPGDVFLTFESGQVLHHEHMKVVPALVEFLAEDRVTVIDHAEVSRWENAFPNPRDPPDPPRDDFFRTDNQRFYVRVIDAEPVTIESVVEATIKTIDGQGNVVDSVENFELEEDPPGSGEFYSGPFLLVSNSADDSYSRPPEIGEDGTPTDPTLNIFSPDVFTEHPERILVGGTVKVEYRTGEGMIAAGTRLPDCEPIISVCDPAEIKSIKVRPIVLRQAVQVIHEHDVLLDIAMANLGWAQCCIRIDPTGPVEFVDPPAAEDFEPVGFDHDGDDTTPDVNPTAGFDFLDINCNGLHDDGEPSEPFTDGNRNRGYDFRVNLEDGGLNIEHAHIDGMAGCVKPATSMTPEVRNLIDTLSDNDPQTIEIFVVNEFVEPVAGDTTLAFAYKSGANVIVTKNLSLAFGYVLAHEIAHVALNAGHVDDSNNILFETMISIQNSVTGPKRFTEDQCMSARGFASR